MRRESGRGYPLTTLFLLIAAAAVVLAMLGPLIRRFDDLGIGGSELTVGVVLSVVGMIATGAVLGLMHESRLFGVFWGGFVGGLLGLVVGPVIFIPPDMFSIVLATALGGSTLIILFSTLISLFSAPKDALQVEAAPNAKSVKPKRHPLDPDPEDE